MWRASDVSDQKYVQQNKTERKRIRQTQAIIQVPSTNQK